MSSQYLFLKLQMTHKFNRRTNFRISNAFHIKNNITLKLFRHSCSIENTEHSSTNISIKTVCQKRCIERVQSVNFYTFNKG